MRKLLFLIFTFAIFFMNQGIAFSSENTVETEILDEANQAYKEGDFEEAKNKYKRLISFGINNGILYYNLGNSYLKLNENGQAIANYLKAKKYLPRDQRINSNLNRALNISNINLEKNYLDYIFFISKQLNKIELITIFLITWVVLISFLIIRIYKQHPIINSFTIIFIILFLILFPNVIYNNLDLYIKNGVVITENANIKISSDENSETIFQVKEGNLLLILEKNNDWNKVQINGNKGWIKSESIESI